MACLFILDGNKDNTECAKHVDDKLKNSKLLAKLAGLDLDPSLIIVLFHVSLFFYLSGLT